MIFLKIDLNKYLKELKVMLDVKGLFNNPKYMQLWIYYIAEVGLAHDKSLGIAHSYIDALAKTE